MTTPFRSDQAASSLMGEHGAGNAGHGKRIGEPGQSRQGEESDGRGPQMLSAWTYPSNEAEGGDGEIDRP